MNKYGWVENEEGQIFVFNQEESVKPKNIVEKIDFESKFHYFCTYFPLSSTLTSDFKLSFISKEALELQTELPFSLEFLKQPVLISV